MTRDLRVTTRPVKIERFTPEGVRVSTTTYTHVSVDQYRSDANGTVRNPNGPFTEPTSYQARFFTGQSFPFDYRYLNNGAKYRALGESTDVSWTVQTMEVLGCSPGSKLPNVSGSVISACESRVLGQIRDNDWNVGQSIGEIPELIQSIQALILAIRDAIEFFRTGGLRPAVRQLLEASSKRATTKAAEEAAAYIARFDKLRATGGKTLSRRQSAKLFSKGNKTRIRELDKAFQRRANTLRRSRYQTGKFAATSWLVNEMALKPLLSDIYAMCKLITEGISQPSGFRARAEMEDPLRRPSVKAGVIDLGGSFTAKRGVVVDVSYRINNPFLFDLERYGLTDPLTVAWELVPLSFVVDWFVPIGAFLDSLGGKLGLVFEHGYRTLYCDWAINQNFRLNSQIVDGLEPKYSAKLRAMNRQPYISFPSPVPYFRGFGNFSVGKSVTSLALAVSKM